MTQGTAIQQNSCYIQLGRRSVGLQTQPTANLDGDAIDSADWIQATEFVCV